MADIPQWRLVGDWFDVCSCDIPCPCEFAQPPTNNHCEGVLAYRIREGNYGDVRLDGLNVLAVGAFDGNLWAGEATLALGIFIDERADERQREALQGDRAAGGGWPATLAGLSGRLGDRVRPVRGRGRRRPGPLAREVPAKWSPAPRPQWSDHPARQRVQLLNPPAVRSPGQVATWGMATPSRWTRSALLELTGKSSKHIPFDWSGLVRLTVLRRLLEGVEADDRAGQHGEGIERRSSARSGSQPPPAPTPSVRSIVQR